MRSMAVYAVRVVGEHTRRSTRRHMKRGRTIVIAAVLTLGLYHHTQAQRPAALASLTTRPAVKTALDAVKAGEAQTIADQVRFCEVPAPPFQEAARGQLLRSEFSRLGLQNVRVDRVVNVLGDRPGEK